MGPFLPDGRAKNHVFKRFQRAKVPFIPDFISDRGNPLTEKKNELRMNYDVWTISIN